MTRDAEHLFMYLVVNYVLERCLPLCLFRIIFSFFFRSFLVCAHTEVRRQLWVLVLSFTLAQGLSSGDQAWGRHHYPLTEPSQQPTGLFLAELEVLMSLTLG